MSKRGTLPGASRREYAAAEERLLDYFSPPSDAEDASNVSASDSLQHSENMHERLVDPSKDNMLPFISDSSEIHSLLVCSDTTSFKGFNDEYQDFDNEDANTAGTQKQTLVFGMFRRTDNFGALAADNFMDCPTTTKRALLSQKLNASAPIALLEASTTADFMLTNGNSNSNESTNEEQLTIESQHVIGNSDSECIIYDDDNVVMLSDDNCCEIIVSAHGVHTEQEMERAYLMGLPTVPVSERGQLNNRACYGSDFGPAEEDEEPRTLPHVYLSDAAIDQQQQQPQDQQLLLDAAEEDVNQLGGSYVDERPDICEVFDHELEDHDDDCAENEQEGSSLQLQLQHVALEQQQQLTVPNDVEELPPSSNNSDVVELQAKQFPNPVTATAAIAHSSTTEFPVSSTSMPNGSDYDDFDDELGTADEQTPPAQRKYMPLLKNTLSADAMERRLAYIGQSQPQMSLTEKVAIWNCAQSCEAVEDVENFEAEFEQHEAEPAKEPKFGEFCEILRQSLSKMKLAIHERSMGDAPHAGVTPHTPYSSEDATRHKRPCFRRLLHTMPQAQQSEPIVVDDDDEDDDDCIEVTLNPSSSTLVPKLYQKHEQREPVVKTIQTQTHSPSVEAKETSTTDLRISRPKSYDELGSDSLRRQAADAQKQINMHFEEMMALQQPQNEHSSAGRINSVDEQFYQQHEFCNYLGLTGLATANAVANAMRELANHNVARRSLRVRTQQQLDKMRIGERSKRREKQEQQQQQQDPHQQQDKMEQQLITDTSSTCSNNSSRKHTVTASTFVYPRPSPISTVTAAAPAIQYYYRAQGGEQQQQQQNNSMVVANDYHAMSLEAAFAKVYAAAAPAQKELHESMQKRLRKARETKPSIYIVQALDNATSPTSAVNPVTNNPPKASPKSSPERQQYNKKADQAVESKPVRKSTKKLATKSAKRRRTTAGGIVATPAPERELVTRSTTHMNSKLLRNRKVNLLKSYELSDAVLARGKKRLTGGSTPSGKGSNTPKAVKKGLKKLAHMVISQAASDHSPHQDPHEQPQSSPKPKKTKAHHADQKASTKKKRLRAKSLPAALDGEHKKLVAGMGDTNAGEGTTELRLVQKPHACMDTQEFITNHAVVCPPLYTAAMHRYVNAVYKPLEQHPLEQQPLERHSSEREQQQQPDGFCDLSAAYMTLPKPALTYPPLSPPPSQRAPHFSRRARQMAGTAIESAGPSLPDIQLSSTGGLLSLSKGSTPQRNPLVVKNGKVLYIYYELEQLIVVQEKQVSFWKYSKVFNVLNKPKAEENNATAMQQQHTMNSFGTSPQQKARRNTEDSNESDGSASQRWVHLGGTRHISNDIEIYAPYSNRICTHNSTPVYVEMRSHPLEHHKRESKLLTLYVNVYYYCEEELRPKMHSVHLDAVNCEWNQVIYTSIADSRYFVMAWQQEVVVGKPRAGICKYSLTPTLDTLASIREFKQLRHELRHIECLTEDRLIGYGQTRITIWDHRSGDTLMNYDFNFNLGHNLGVMHYPSFDIDQSNMLVLYQHVKESNQWSELRIIACELSHATPSHRVLHMHRLPSPQFDGQLVAINTGDHLILKSPLDDEIWISTTDPRQLTYLAPQSNQRFYTRHKAQIITLTQQTLVVDSIANHVLKMAAEQQKKMMRAAMEMMASSSSKLPVSV